MFETGIGWLVGCFRFNGPLRQYFSLYRAVYQRGRKRREKIDESKNVQTTPPAPPASATGPCPTIQIVGRPGTGSLPSTIAPTDHPPRQAYFELMNVNHSTRTESKVEIFFLFFFNMMVYRVFSLESPHRGASNEKQNIPFSIQKRKSP